MNMYIAANELIFGKLGMASYWRLEDPKNACVLTDSLIIHALNTMRKNGETDGFMTKSSAYVITECDGMAPINTLRFVGDEADEAFAPYTETVIRMQDSGYLPVVIGAFQLNKLNELVDEDVVSIILGSNNEPEKIFFSINFQVKPCAEKIISAEEWAASAEREESEGMLVPLVLFHIASRSLVAACDGISIQMYNQVNTDFDKMFKENITECVFEHIAKTHNISLTHYQTVASIVNELADEYLLNEFDVKNLVNENIRERQITGVALSISESMNTILDTSLFTAGKFKDIAAQIVDGTYFVISDKMEMLAAEYREHESAE